MKLLFAGAVVAGGLMLGAAGPKPDAKWTSDFAKEPTHDQVMALLPEASRQENGYAAMRCKVAANASLADCHVIQETPSGSGFGQALLALAPEYRVKSPAEGGPAPGSDVVDGFDTFHFDNPANWLRKPSERDLLVVWPKKAWAAGRSGAATIACLVSIQGAVYGCIVVSETPAGENFGSAAIALTPQFLMKPATLRGTPVISLARIPVNFTMPAGAHPDTDSRSRQMVQAVMAWPEAPTYSEVAAAYPKKAREKNLGGRATLDCSFTKQGRLFFCSTVAEEPRGQGFADAAKLLAKRFRAFPTTSTGEPLTGAGVQLPVVFDPAMLTDAKPIVGKPQWAGLPSAEDTRSAFSRVESGHGTVRVMLTCVVQQGGGVSNCKVEREEPAGIGVGQAALALAPRFRLSTWTAEGLPTVGGTIHIPLRYEGGTATPPPAKP
jgi:hypothetical protein